MVLEHNSMPLTFLLPLIRFLMKYVTATCPLDITITVIFLVPFLGVFLLMFMYRAILYSVRRPQGTSGYMSTFRGLITYLWRNKEVLRGIFFTSSIYNHFKHSPFIDRVHSLNNDNKREYLCIYYKLR